MAGHTERTSPVAGGWYSCDWPVTGQVFPDFSSIFGCVAGRDMETMKKARGVGEMRWVIKIRSPF
jgi:hypothetical protein